MDFTPKLIEWYRLNKRPLPWRQTADPYRIWVSEIILQQTRVEQGREYYHNFLEKFPDVQSLAVATDDEVMKTWQGLGYYSRARNLHEAAQQVVNDFDGKFPENYEDILSLKGVGDYSASAISSIAFNGKHPVIDGNVLRFMARYLGIEEPVNMTRGRRIIQQKLEELIDEKEPGTFNQAVMEYGALVCKPRQPLCNECIFMEECIAYRSGKIAELPVKTYKNPVKKRFFNYFFIMGNEKNSVFTYLNKRDNKDIWRNLYDFPMIETDRTFDIDELMDTEDFRSLFPSSLPHIYLKSKTYIHKLSHRELHIDFYVLESKDFNNLHYKKIKIEDLHTYPIPRLIDLFLQDYLEKILKLKSF